MGKKCSNKVDVFSMGVILWELITGEAPNRGRMRSLRYTHLNTPPEPTQPGRCSGRHVILRQEAL